MSPPLAAPVIWLFGLPSSGKTTLAAALRDRLASEGRQVIKLDGDVLRSGLNRDLGFSDADRDENLSRAAHIAKLISDQGTVVIAAFVTPKEHHRETVRGIIGAVVRFVHVDCPLEVCMARDVKGLYAKASAGGMSGMSGLQDPFEPPAACDLVLQTSTMSAANSIGELSASIRSWLHAADQSAASTAA